MRQDHTRSLGEPLWNTEMNWITRTSGTGPPLSVRPAPIEGSQLRTASTRTNLWNPPTQRSPHTISQRSINQPRLDVQPTYSSLPQQGQSISRPWCPSPTTLDSCPLQVALSTLLSPTPLINRPHHATCTSQPHRKVSCPARMR